MISILVLQKAIFYSISKSVVKEMFVRGEHHDAACPVRVLVFNQSGLTIFLFALTNP